MWSFLPMTDTAPGKPSAAWSINSGREARPEAPPQLSTQFNVYSFFVRDPNGYKLEFQSFRDPAWGAGTA